MPGASEPSFKVETKNERLRCDDDDDGIVDGEALDAEGYGNDGRGTDDTGNDEALGNDAPERFGEPTAAFDCMVSWVRSSK